MTTAPSSPLLLIDGDQFLFKATAAVEEEIRWDEQNHVLYSNVEKAWTNLQGMIRRIHERFDTAQHAVCFSTYPGFRSQIDASYKATRAARKPLCYAALRIRMEDTYTCISMPALEADDVMGILATKPGKVRRIIVSQDKDMKTIPGELWDGKDLHSITLEQADWWHLTQTLTGDTVDEYKGCPGVGPVKAEKILQAGSENAEGLWHSMGKDLNETEHGPYGPDPTYPFVYSSMWDAVVEAFMEHEKIDDEEVAEEHALTQARLARILRWTDWDSETKQPILWSPPSNG